jgi:copper chaperone CopZ
MDHTTTTTTATVRQTFRVDGMSCHHCEMAVTAELMKLSGVIGVAVDIAAATVVTEAEQTLDRDAVAAAIDDAGYELA